MWKHNPLVRESFETARSLLAPDLEDKIIDIPDLSQQTVGTFDIVLFSGVFYHLRHPLLILERIAPLATETLIVETHLDALELERPAMVMYPEAELNNDPTNWWGPNPSCVIAMLRDVGFAHVDFQPNPNHAANRGIFHGRR
jgi:tRNA (mo5U34)-methyltransferase